MEFELIVPIILLAFVCELVDSTLGMGYGTTLTPLLLILGYDPIVIVPAVLFSEFLTGISAGFFHHEFGNVDLRPGSQASKVAAVLTVFGIVGVVFAVVIAVNLPAYIVKLYIGLLVLSMGILILLKRDHKSAFSWRRIAGLGLLAAFNKGISGGGYGPVVTSGQVLSGIRGRTAVAIASMAEGVTSFVGVGIYLAIGTPFPWQLAPSLLIGALLSVPLSAYFVSRIPSGRLTLIIGGFTTMVGGYTLLRVFI